MSYVFEVDRLDRIADARSVEFCSANPYPHVVIDDFLRPEAADLLAREFPGADALAWDHYAAAGLEVKLGSSREEDFPELHRSAIHDLNSGIFIRFLERLSGIDSLLPDPHLFGGGLHITRRDGVLGIHADFNWHEKLQAHRRLNLLIYLTPDIKPEYGGELELWDTKASRMVRKIEPLFNRAVLFVTRSDTFHGHPNPWAAPMAIDRQSIAMYYYTTERPAEELRAPHSTLYKGVHA
jgi:2-oxoglutarate-Fe(II)-dependent oxygenase superfamily protein